MEDIRRLFKVRINNLDMKLTSLLILNLTTITEAQKEMSQSDVLVCGKCQNVFHYIDLFNEHKSSNCNKASSLKDVVSFIMIHNDTTIFNNSLSL